MRIKISQLKKLVQEALTANSSSSLYATIHDTQVDLSTVINVQALQVLLDDLFGQEIGNRAAADYIVQSVVQILDKDLNKIAAQSDINPNNSFGVPSIEADNS